MSAVSGRTRLGLEILAAGAGVGVAGDALLRAVPWGLNALLCTTGLVAAAAWLVRRHRVAASSDAPWLAAAALLIASNFVARDSRTLHAFDTIGLVIVLAVAFPSIQGVGLRGRQAWHYVRAGCDAAVSAWLGVFPLVSRDVFLDNEMTAAGVEKELAHVEAVARANGLAIAIGHPHDATLAALARWLPSLEAKGFQLVPLSAAARPGL